MAAENQAKEAKKRFVERGLKSSPPPAALLWMTPLCSVPTASEAVPRCWSETLGCCKGAGSDRQEGRSSPRLHGPSCV